MLGAGVSAEAFNSLATEFIFIYLSRPVNTDVNLNEACYSILNLMKR